MPVSAPVAVHVASRGIAFAESVHGVDFRMAERSEHFHKLLFVQRGRVAFHAAARAGGEKRFFDGAAGSLWIVPAGRRHRVEDIEPSVILLLCLGGRLTDEDEMVRPLWRRIEALGEHPLPLRATARHLEGWWRRALLESRRNDVGSEAAQYAIALHLLVAIARADVRTGSSAAERVRRVGVQIERTLCDAWSLDGAAAAAGLSRRHFTQIFRAETGMSFIEFLSARRLEYAEHLLASGRHTVTGAAFSAGFEDLSHFYRLFRRRNGMPPNAWLERRGQPQGRR